MNEAKAYFAMLYMFTVAAIVIVATYRIVFVGFNLTWLGALLTALPFLAFYVWISYIKGMARTSPRLPVLTLFTLAGFCLAAYGFSTGSEAAYVPLAAAAIAAVGFLLYVNWYSIFNRRVSPQLQVGGLLPVFEVQDRDGNLVRSDVLLGKPALLLFYRGRWCPICMAHVDEVALTYRALIERGVQVAMISPQPHDLTRRVAELYDVPISFWIDAGAKAARQLGILNEQGVPAGFRKSYGADTVFPTTIITDEQSRILFAHQTRNFRIRPSPEMFMEVFAAHSY